MRNRKLAMAVIWFLPLCFPVLSGGTGALRAQSVHAARTKLPDLAGQMPSGFDQDVARVVADLDHIEAHTLREMSKTTLD